MFQNFSFDAASRHPSDFALERAYMDISPTSSPWPLPSRANPTAMTIGELSQRFSAHSIEVDPSYQRTSYFEPATSPSDQYPQEVDSAYSSRRTSYAHIYNGLSPAALRLQRQANVRLQCNTSHVKDISSLVERMMAEGEQCRICTRPRSKDGLSATSSDDEDERAEPRRSSSSDNPAFTLKYRRSGERLGGQACVSKTVRLRKIKSRRSLPSKA